MGDLQKIGKYVLLEAQESTGVAQTWRGAEMVNHKIDKYCLVDFIKESLASDKGFLDHFLNQSLIAAKLEHPNILRKITALHENGKAVALFEYQEGFSLQKVLERCHTDGFPLSIDHALLVTSKLLSALSYAKNKHVPHGFVNPSVVFVTNEGEIKLKGFAFSSALRHCVAPPVLDSFYNKYVPKGMAVVSEDRDLLDIFGCGSVLFEMLTGEPYHDGSANPNRIATAVTATEGEPIPPKIVKILRCALEVGTPHAYRGIQAMAKDMEELLFSGEYSPTTFNLAFFMHSAFRMEMEELAEKRSKEKATSFASRNISTVPTPEPSAHRSAPVVPPVRDEPVASSYAAAPPPKKSKMGLILALLGVLVVVAAGTAYFMMGGKGDDKIAQRKADLLRESQESDRKLLMQQQEDLRRQNEELLRQIQDQAEEQEQQRKSDLEAEMQRMDDQIAELKAEEAKKEEARKLQADRAKLEKEQQDLAKRLEEQQKERERLEQLIKDREAREAAAEKVAENTPAEQDPSVSAPAQDQPGDGIASSNPNAPANPPTDGDNSQSNQETPSGADVSAANPSLIPEEGDMVALDDEELNPPVLIEPYKTLDAPKKAVKSGIVKRDKTIGFLMKVLVDTDGRVEDVELFRSPLKPGQDDYGMVNESMRAARKLRFSSPTKRGVKVKVWMFLNINFRGR